MFHCMRVVGFYMTLYIDYCLMRAFLWHQLMQDALMTFILEAALGWSVSTERPQAPPNKRQRGRDMRSIGMRRSRF